MDKTNFSTNSSTPTTSNNKDNNIDEPQPPQPQQSTNSKPHGQGKKNQSNRNNNNNNNNTTDQPPCVIFCYDNRDLVVVDSDDINESTKSSTVTVVPAVAGGTDLVDIIGSQVWPNLAGNAVEMLNNSDKKTNGVSRSNAVNHYHANTNRIRSVNVIDHIGGPSKQKSTNTIERNTNGVNSRHHHYDNVAASLSSTEDYLPPPPPPSQSNGFSNIPNSIMELGTMIEIDSEFAASLHGVIRWIGVPPGENNKHLMVGVEIEDELIDYPIDATDGTFNGHRLFKCTPGKGILIPPIKCSIDRRFDEVTNVETSGGNIDNGKIIFGGQDCPIVKGYKPPIQIADIEELTTICGKFRGIQGHHNSCYLDATLFSMYAFTYVFDSLLFRPSNSKDSAHYDLIKDILREEIINPLRTNHFVRADRVLRLRELLENHCSVKGLTNEEKDPEEFINILLSDTLKANPYLKLSSGQESYLYQLFPPQKENLTFPSVQQLFEQSFQASNIKLMEVPSCLIVQMPRFGKDFKMYPRILPTELLDVTDVIANSPRQCNFCGKVANVECKTCFESSTNTLDAATFCNPCFVKYHTHPTRLNHTHNEFEVPSEFLEHPDDRSPPRIVMELFAVVCIETSHYVSFVKSGPGQNAPWCFFDSMADRQGGQNGHNIPEMKTVPELPKWINEESAKKLHDSAKNDKQLPDLAKRLLCDAYLCMYQSSDVSMYQ